MAVVAAALNSRLQWGPMGSVPCSPWGLGPPAVVMPKIHLKDTCLLRQILSFNSFRQVRKKNPRYNGPKWAFHNSVDLPTLPYYGNFLYSVHVLSAKCLRSESHFLVGFFAATTAFIIGLATHKFSTLDSQGIHP